MGRIDTICDESVENLQGICGEYEAVVKGHYRKFRREVAQKASKSDPLGLILEPVAGLGAIGVGWGPGLDRARAQRAEGNTLRGVLRSHPGPDKTPLWHPGAPFGRISRPAHPKKVAKARPARGTRRMSAGGCDTGRSKPWSC